MTLLRIPVCMRWHTILSRCTLPSLAPPGTWCLAGTRCAYRSVWSPWLTSLTLPLTAPGIPDCADPSPSPTLDLVCMHAAACDLAVHDEGFRNTVSRGVGMLAALLTLYNRVLDEWRGEAEAEGLILLMDLQFARYMAACTPVRTGPLW